MTVTASKSRAKEKPARGARVKAGMGAAWAWGRKLITLPHVLVMLYLLVGGLLVVRHGIWRDEAQAFLIARDSAGLGELIWNMRYEGHPPLWHILLWGLTRVTVRPEAMQWLHLLMAAGSVYLVARFAPFGVRAKILFAFGYFPLFEYGIIARNYQAFLLLTLAFCALWQWGLGRGSRPYLALGMVLGLLSLTHVLGTILAAALGVMLLLESALTRDGWRAVRRHWIQYPLAIVIAAAGAWMSVQVMNPAPDGTFTSREWHTRWDAPKADLVAGSLWQAYVPIPAWGNWRFWNTHFMAGGGPSSLLSRNPVDEWKYPWGAPATRGIVMACGAVVLMLMTLSWRAVVFFVISSGGMLLFAYCKFSGYMRHHGGLFVALVGAFWIAWVFWRDPPVDGGAWGKLKRILRAVPREAFVALLILHVVAAYVACFYAWRHPFSVGRETAALLRSELAPEDQLMGSYDPMIASVAAYVPGRTFRMSGATREGTFTLWRDGYARSAGISEARALARRTGKPVVLVNVGRLSGRLTGAVELGGFEAGIVADESYYLYRVMPPGEGEPPERQPGFLERLLKGEGR